MSTDELAVMDGGKCILQVQGVRPFFSDKFDITKHPQYKYLLDSSKKNAFDIAKYLSRRLTVRPDDVYVMGRKQVVEVGSSRVRNRDESEWFRIPDHHPAIISKELFQRVQELKPKKRCIKKNVHLYPLRGKVFCGCCGHAMPRNPSKSHFFVCKHTEVDQSAACHGLRIAEKDLEAILYEIISRQAQVILNVENLSNASLLDTKIATHTEYSQRVESCLDRKRVLYEQALLKEITLEDYKAQKADVDAELERLRQVQGALSAEIAQAKMDAKTKNARLELAQEISAASGLNTALADALIERVDIHPGNQVDIVWKMKDFCTEGM